MQTFLDLLSADRQLIIRLGATGGTLYLSFLNTLNMWIDVLSGVVALLVGVFSLIKLIKDWRKIDKSKTKPQYIKSQNEDKNP